MLRKRDTHGSVASRVKTVFGECVNCKYLDNPAWFHSLIVIFDVCWLFSIVECLNEKLKDWLIWDFCFSYMSPESYFLMAELIY